MTLADEFVVLDTGVFGFLYVDPARALRRGYPLERWRKELAGVRPLISFQTRAESLYGALNGQWGARKRDHLQGLLARIPTIWPDDSVVAAEVRLRHEAHVTGHGLAAKPQASDRWIAACAVAHDLPLCSLDNKAFNNAPLIRRFMISSAETP